MSANLLSSVLFPAAVAAGAQQITGILTYGPLFGPSWAAALRREKNNPKIAVSENYDANEMTQKCVLNFLVNITRNAIHLELLRLLVRAPFVNPLSVRPRSFLGLAATSVALWLGFQVPMHAEQILWEERMPYLGQLAVGRGLVDLILTTAIFRGLHAI